MWRRNTTSPVSQEFEAFQRFDAPPAAIMDVSLPTVSRGPGVSAFARGAGMLRRMAASRGWLGALLTALAAVWTLSCSFVFGSGAAIPAELAVEPRLVIGAGAGTLEGALVFAYQNNPQLNAQRAATRAIDEGVATALAR